MGYRQIAQANLAIVRKLLNDYGFTDLVAAYNRARFFVADGLQDKSAGWTLGDDVTLKSTEFPPNASMNELIRITAHELAHVRGADEGEAMATEAVVMQKMGIASPPVR